MATGKQHGLEVDRSVQDLSVSSRLPEPRVPVAERPVIIFDEPPSTPNARQRVLLVVAGTAVLAAVVAGAAAARSADSDHTVVARPAGGAAAPAGGAPAALALTVDGPSVAVVGQPARYVVHYADGAGEFSGGSEDWGDVGASSVRERSCAPPAPTAEPTKGHYAVRHVWTEPGSYPVSIGVTTYTCREGAAVPETAVKTFVVTVSPS